MTVPLGPKSGVRLAAAIAVATCVLAAICFAEPVPQSVLDNKKCLDCHGQKKIIDLPADERITMLDAPRDQPLPEHGPRPGLHVTARDLAGSVHANVGCVECHADAAELPHKVELKAVTCNACHEDAAAAFNRSTHALARAENPAGNAPNCVDCHGGHQILGKADRKSPIYPLNVVNLCADCHSEHSDKTPNGHDPGEFTNDYLESVHGKALMKQGLVVAASCVDCHRAHEVLPATDPASTVHRKQVPETCGKCHEGVAEVFATSVHATKMAAGEDAAPVCTDCHTAHSITRASEQNFKLDIINECGDCHDKPLHEGGLTLYETYRTSYHGQATNLGSLRGARCSDCHGAHDIRPNDDPASRVHPDNLVETCATCHPRANASFAQFKAHADHTVWGDFPLLHGVWLYFLIVISSTFAAFGLHTIAWFIRSSIEHWRNGKHVHHGEAKYGIRRFRRVDRINHALMVVSFFGLTLTGMPLLFSDQYWAQVLAACFGGVHAAGVLHRIFGLMLIGNFVLHLVGVWQRIREAGWKNVLIGPNSLMFRWRDVTDAIAMVKWFFRGGKQPTFDRWTYWEKFDYGAEIFGTFVIGGTGLMLWFPDLFAMIMPGWMFNIAMIVHGYEALLAVGFIFTIHFFNANLRPEKFPVDTVIFTGYMPEHEFVHERGDEFKRMLEAGQVELLKVPTVPAWKIRVAIVCGMLAMAIGITMVVLIVLAGLELL